MTTQEFSNEFDVLYNNIMSNAAPGLDEYEKSVFLTKAQNEVLKNYFNPQGNKYKEGFDASPKRQIDFSSLVIASSPEAYSSENFVKFDDRSLLFKMPTNILFVLNETATCKADDVERSISIIPVTFAEYTKAMSKPYKQPLKNQGWRLFQSTGSGVNYISEIIVKNGATLTNYRLRYVKRPTPIILSELKSSNLSIDGVDAVTECTLDPIIHPEILQRAVELAKAAYTGDAKSTVDFGFFDVGRVPAVGAGDHGVFAGFAPGQVGQMHQTVDTTFQTDEDAKVGQGLDLTTDLVTLLVVDGEIVPRVGHALLHAQGDTATVFVDLKNHHFNFVAQLDNLGRVNVLVGPVHFGDVHQAFDTLLDFDECAVVGDVGHLAEQAGALRVTTGDADPRIFAQLLEAQGDAVLLLVELEHLGFEFVADGQDFGRVTHTTPGQVGDVQQAVDAAEIHECAVVGDVLDDTLDDGAFLEGFEELLTLFTHGSFEHCEYQPNAHRHLLLQS